MKPVKQTLLLSEIKAVVWDLDGTVYIGDNLVEGAKEIIHWFHSNQKQICMISNNSTKKTSEIEHKLKALGINSGFDMPIINSAYAMAKLARKENFLSCYVVGSDGLKSELSEEGIVIRRENVDAVIIGLDTHFSYHTLNEVINILKKEKCHMIACNMDRTYPLSMDYLGSGCGAIVAAIEYASGRSCDGIVGKPETFMLDLYMEQFDIKPQEILTIGDQYDSDILMAKRAGTKSILLCEEDQAYCEATICITNLFEVQKVLK